MDARPEWIRESKAPPKIDPSDHLAMAKAIRELYRDPTRFTKWVLVRTPPLSYTEGDDDVVGWRHPRLAQKLKTGHAFCLRGARLMFVGFESHETFDLAKEQGFVSFLGLRDINDAITFNNSYGYQHVCDLLDRAIEKAESAQ